MKKSGLPPSNPDRGHRPRNIQPTHHDPYAARRKDRDAMVCDSCAVVGHGGRWRWGAPPLTDVRGGLCPACERIRDHYPAGTLRLPGIPAEDLTEIRALIANTEAAERTEHPLERLMDVEEEDGGLVVTTTGVHLARRLANALERRLHRQLSFTYGEDGELVQITWKEAPAR